MAENGDAKFAYLIGALADGSVYYNKKQYIYRVTYYQHSKEYLLKCIEPLIDNLFGKKGYFYYDQRTEVHSFIIASKQIYQKYMARIEEFKSEQNRSVPTWIKTGDKQVRYAFIRGFFDADGFFYLYSKRHDYRVRLGQSEYYILKDIKEMLENEHEDGFRVSDVLGPYQSKEGVKPYYELHLYGIDQVKQFHSLIRPCHPEKQLDLHFA
ncbi:MAG: LAGLIDADG family homing endonuclease [Promethearchaeota archaeon]